MIVPSYSCLSQITWSHADFSQSSPAYLQILLIQALVVVWFPVLPLWSKLLPGYITTVMVYFQSSVWNYLCHNVSLTENLLMLRMNDDILIKVDHLFPAPFVFALSGTLSSLSFWFSFTFGYDRSHLQHWHPIWVIVHVLAILLWIQYPAYCLGKHWKMPQVRKPLHLWETAQLWPLLPCGRSFLPSVNLPFK